MAHNHIPAQRTPATDATVKLWAPGMTAGTKTLGRIRIASVDFEFVRAVRIDDNGDTHADDYNTHRVNKADLLADPITELAVEIPTQSDNRVMHPITIEKTALLTISGDTLKLLTNPMHRNETGYAWSLELADRSTDPYRDEYTVQATHADLTWMASRLEALKSVHSQTDVRYVISCAAVDVHFAQIDLATSK